MPTLNNPAPVDVWGDGEETGSDDDEEEDDNGDNNDDGSSRNENDIDLDNVEKFIRNVYNDGYDIDFDIALCFDRNVTLPGRPNQALYNKPENWRQRNRIGLEKVKRQLLTCIDSMTHNAHFNLDLNHISIGQNQQFMNNEEPIVWHEPIVDRYWDVLEAEIDRMKQLDNVTTDIRKIQIMNVEMKKDRLAALVAIFRSGRATNSRIFVNFHNANICADGIISLSELVDVSSELQIFHLHHNRIDNMESARCLFRSLKSHIRIDQLHLTHCDLGSNPEILFVVLQSDVEYINLENNNIDSLGAVKIAEYLESDPPIEELCLAYNKLNDDDAILISQALKRNTELYHINLVSNNISSIGVKAVLTCVFDSSSLNAISESNHTLGGMDMFLKGNNEISDRLQDCIDRMLELDRRTQKILLALRDKDSLLQYLANVPVELIPDVLAFFHGHVVDEHQQEHLNILYSTMRWWNMPTLYSYHSCVKLDTKRKRDDSHCLVGVPK